MSYASWGKRVLATLVDFLILVPFYIVAFIVGGPSADINAGTTSAGSPLYYIFILLAAVVAIYNVIFQQGRTGQTWGKKAIGIRLIGEQTGAPIGAGMVFVRALCHIVDSLPCYIGYLWPIWDAKRQTFADKIMKTFVVSA